MLKESWNHKWICTPTNSIDQLWHDIDDGKFGSDAKTGSWFVGISSVRVCSLNHSSKRTQCH